MGLSPRIEGGPLSVQARAPSPIALSTGQDPGVFDGSGFDVRPIARASSDRTLKGAGMTRVCRLPLGLQRVRCSRKSELRPEEG